MNINFGIELVKRNILAHGQEFTFHRPAQNIFNEPTSNETLITLQGLFHQTRGYITRNTTDGTVSRSQPQPMVLALVNPESQSLQINDYMLYCNQKYRVTGINDINNLGMALEISLELIDNGV